MMKRGRNGCFGAAADYPPNLIIVAKDRCAFLTHRLVNCDMSLKNALASAYLQGMTDAIDCLQAATPSPPTTSPPPKPPATREP
jgi:hypothetical protein